MPVISQGGREGSQGNRKRLVTFSLLSNGLKDLIWWETFSQKRIFDDDTLRLLNPRNGIMYSYLTPYALFVCRYSRELARGRLRCSHLSVPWSDETRRPVVYFNPEYDVCVNEWERLHWRQLDGQCMFSCVKIIADVSSEDLTSDREYGLRSVAFHGLQLCTGIAILNGRASRLSVTPTAIESLLEGALVLKARKSYQNVTW